MSQTTYTWSALSSGSWATASNWSGGVVPQGIVPGNIIVHPDFGGGVDGPNVSTVSTNFTLGADSGITRFAHYYGALLAFTGNASIESSGKFDTGGTGEVFAVQGTLTNAGEIITHGQEVNAGLLTNSGLLRGYGNIGAPVVNSGRIEALDQTSEYVFRQTVTNQAGALIAVRKSNVRVLGGVTNQGALSFGDGVADFYADVNNTGSVGASSGSIVSIVGDLKQNGNLSLVGGSRLIVYGEFSGTGGSTGTGSLEILGKLTVGSSAASVNFGGSVLLGNGASTLIELGGHTLGEYDAIHVANSISLGGPLDVSLLNGFTPQVGDRFDVVTAGNSVRGQFTEGVIPNLGPNVKVKMFYSPTSAVLAVVPAINGDYNADGVVDAADYVLWRNSIGQVGLGLISDGDGNNVVDFGDYSVLRAHFGQTASSSAMLSAERSPSETVPEPTTWMLVIFMSFLFTARFQQANWRSEYL